jgi:hypothetical protein
MHRISKSYPITRVIIIIIVVVVVVVVQFFVTACCLNRYCSITKS